MIETARARCLQGLADVMSVLIEAGADVNAKGYRGRTALDQAKQWRNAEGAELLRKMGADE